MTVGELKEMLASYDEDLQVVVAQRTPDDYWSISDSKINDNNDLELLIG